MAGDVDVPGDVEAESGVGPGSRPRRADARRNQERLIEAARKVFTDQGGSASMEAIAKQAGVGVGTLYRHFPQRIDVVEAVWRDDVDSLVDSVDQGLSDLEPWDALAAWLRAFVAYGRAKRVFLNELHEAFEKDPSKKVGSRQRIQAAAEKVLKRAQAAGVARQDIDGEDLMQLVSPMCISPTLEADRGDRLIAMVIDGLRPPPS